ncbi:signal peptidase I [Streptomyces sp. NPDC050485]|uniref:signal peptidase I n=1 Tax=Streptomyces sp. NPDC050485 TaxID=3365617 RepID=UPI0037BC28D1
MNSRPEPNETPRSGSSVGAPEGEGQGAGSVGGHEESWFRVLRVAGCRTAVTVVTSLLCMPLAALACGWSPSVIVSGSMEPSLSRGDVIAVRQVKATEVGGGAVIAFNDPSHGGQLTAHRAIKRWHGDSYETKGDANPKPDAGLVTPDRLKGVVAAVVPFVGATWLWLQGGQWAHLAIAVLLYTIALRGCLEGALAPGHVTARLRRR